MKKHTIIILTFIVLCWSPIHAKDIIGEYVTKPGIFPGFLDDDTDKYESLITYMTWRLKITNDHITFYVYDDQEGTSMTYKIIGDFILCKHIKSEIIKYEPLYIKDDGTLHGMMTVFFKK